MGLGEVAVLVPVIAYTVEARQRGEEEAEVHISVGFYSPGSFPSTLLKPRDQPRKFIVMAPEGRNRDESRERTRDAEWERAAGMNWEKVALPHTLSCAKSVASGKLCTPQGSSASCSAMTQRGGMWVKEVKREGYIDTHS